MSTGRSFPINIHGACAPTHADALLELERKKVHDGTTGSFVECLGGVVATASVEARVTYRIIAVDELSKVIFLSDLWTRREARPVALAAGEKKTDIYFGPRFIGGVMWAGIGGRGKVIVDVRATVSACAWGMPAATRAEVACASAYHWRRAFSALTGRCNGTPKGVISLYATYKFGGGGARDGVAPRYDALAERSGR